ncbi:putative ferric-chelate reductase (NADH) [Rosa chinensis]|uniref:ferric-chelate reductase (NADH) n=1 Tax=Rosa chinensis TaxID=74649 RepID=A0A2P6SN95_ROSCH|nr:putative ferric-chelate reductase (NADH) [Rosa chinensis]
MVMMQMLEWSSTRVSNVAGEIAIVFAIAISTFSTSSSTYCTPVLNYFFCTILPGIFLFIIDRYLRFLQSYQRAKLVSARISPCETIELNFSKSRGLDYNPTSILFINVPSVSKMQWHPFTVTSNSNMEADKLSVVIKSLGSWSQKLYQQLSSNSVDHIQVSVEGPYGPRSSHFLRHKALVMISGGSGITPMISIIREIIFQSTKPDCHVPPVRLICAFKNSADLTMLQLLLPISVTPSNFTQLQFQIEAYVTRETHKQPPPEPHKSLQTLWFKPNQLNSPISLVLGQNTWLWLGAIISSSFVLFLFVLGIVNRFYIYPIDHNTVFIWCKRQNAIEEGKRTQNARSTPTTDIELASSPHNHESLIAQATQVHYGTRPDLKKILLLETKGSDIGVLVSGPRKLRHEVATVCSSSLAHNLHFESISFNW